MFALIVLGLISTFFTGVASYGVRETVSGYYSKYLNVNVAAHLLVGNQNSTFSLQVLLFNGLRKILLI